MRLVHVICGDSAAGMLRHALGESSDQAVIGLLDSISCGGLSNVSSLADWTALRVRFWNSLGPSEDIQPHDFVDYVPVLENANAIHLWLGNGLNEQLLLLWFPWFLRLLDIDLDRLRVVQFPDAFSPRHRTPLLALLNHRELLAHPPPLALTSDDLSLIDRGWAAVVSETPDELRGFLASLPPNHPYRIIRSLLTRYPHQDAGLGHWDYQLLLNAHEHGPRGAYVIGHTLVGPGWDVDPVGDGWLFWRLRRLADPAMSFPLVRLEGNVDELRSTLVWLTDDGRRILEHRANAVQLNGIDDWVAGVHLESAVNRVWFWDGDDLVAG